MQIIQRLTLLSILTHSLLGFAVESDRVIYGDDNRKEVSDPANSSVMIEAAKSTAILINTSSIRQEGEEASILPPITLAESVAVCEDEPFREQPNPGFCSGFLVAPDVMVTAGHCIKNQSDCDSTAFVFDFVDKADAISTTRIDNKNIYFCKSVIAQELNRSNDNDFSVVKLRRVVEDRTPLKFRKEGKAEDNMPITVIGYPSGLPTKISAGANIRMNDNPIYFQANLDTYGGNSGSAVLADDGTVEGILVRGEQDFEIRGDCRVSKRCANDECRGEDVTRATNFASFIPDESEVQRPRLELPEYVTEVNQIIPDNDSRGLVTKFSVDAEGSIAEVSIKIDLDHSYPGDLTVKLVHPDGTEAVIRDRSSDDGGPVEWIYGYEGRVALDLGKFRDKSPLGSWKLEIVDTAVDDVGTLNKASLKIRIYAD